MDIKEHMIKRYSKHWIKVRDNDAGQSTYSQNLIKIIKDYSSRGDKVLEVAIGTGQPFAQNLLKDGYTVYGVDIAPNLINKCKQLNPTIDCRIADAEKLPFNDGFFNLTYCFNSTWYFPNLHKAIDEMIRVTSPGGG